jgi:hypothetical protein
MSYTIEYLESGIVSMVIQGDMTFEDYKQQTMDAANMAATNEANLFLSDNIQQVNRAKLSEILKLYSLFDELLGSKTNRLAVLIRRDHKDYEMMKIFEVSCTLRGKAVKVFKERDEAIRWLIA